MNTSEKHYRLTAVHYYVEDDIKERQLFERLISVNVLKEIKEVAYDSKLKMHFDDEKKSGYLIEIRVEDFRLLLCRRMKQAEDILRRINYLFDRVIVKINKGGKVLSLENFEEIKSNWEQLKMYLLGDYSGDELEEYVEEIDGWFQSEKITGRCIFQYFHFGLLVPGIPAKHTNNWNGKRFVYLSEYELVPFEESVAFLEQKEDERIYQINGITDEENDIHLLKYEGLLTLKQNSIFPFTVNIEIEFLLNDGRNRWTFDLKQERIGEHAPEQEAERRTKNIILS